LYRKLEDTLQLLFLAPTRLVVIRGRRLVSVFEFIVYRRLDEHREGVGGHGLVLFALRLS
jgi:hypothetical protein